MQKSDALIVCLGEPQLAESGLSTLSKVVASLNNVATHDVKMFFRYAPLHEK